MEMEREKAIRKRNAEEAQAILPALLSGEASFAALRRAVEELAASVPADHDILIEAFGLTVTSVTYIPPHMLVFRGTNQEGNNTFAICHFSQLVAKVVYRPKQGPNRVITGFARE